MPRTMAVHTSRHSHNTPTSHYIPCQQCPATNVMLDSMHLNSICRRKVTEMRLNFNVMESALNIFLHFFFVFEKIKLCCHMSLYRPVLLFVIRFICISYAVIFWYLHSCIVLWVWYNVSFWTWARCLANPKECIRSRAIISKGLNKQR